MKELVCWLDDEVPVLGLHWWIFEIIGQKGDSLSLNSTFCSLAWSLLANSIKKRTFVFLKLTHNVFHLLATSTFHNKERVGCIDYD